MEVYCLKNCVSALKVVRLFVICCFYVAFFLFPAFSDRTEVAFSLDVPFVFNLTDIWR